MAPMIAVAKGPKRMAHRPVPVIWEQLPVTDGIFSADRINAKACMDRKDLHILSGIPLGTLSNVYNCKNVRSATIGKIAKTLNVPAESLILDEQAEQIKAAEERDKLIVRYTSLVRQLSEIPKGENWRDEYADLEKLLKAEIAELRDKLGMDVKQTI